MVSTGLAAKDHNATGEFIMLTNSTLPLRMAGCWAS